MKLTHLLYTFGTFQYIELHQIIRLISNLPIWQVTSNIWFNNIPLYSQILKVVSRGTLLKEFQLAKQNKSELKEFSLMSILIIFG